MSKAFNKEMVDFTLCQKRANNEIIDLLSRRIDYLEEDLDLYQKKHFALYDYLTDNKKLVAPYVEFIYSEHKDIAKDEVEAYHDETIDLSKLKCTGDDFEPWDE